MILKVAGYHLEGVLYDHSGSGTTAPAQHVHHLESFICIDLRGCNIRGIPSNNCLTRRDFIRLLYNYYSALSNIVF